MNSESERDGKRNSVRKKNRKCKRTKRKTNMEKVGNGVREYAIKASLTTSQHTSKTKYM